MKILQLVNKPQRRGAEIFASQLGAALCRQGHETRTAYLYPHPEPNALPLQPDDYMLAGRAGHPLEKAGLQPRLLQNLRRVIAAFQPDVVQVGGGRTVKYGALASLFYPARRWILICRNIGQAGDWVNGWPHRLVYRRLVMPRVDGVVSVTQANLEDFRALYQLPAPMTCIPTGIEPDSLRPGRSRAAVRRETNTPPEAPVVLFVGSLSPAKRPDRLLRVVRQAVAHRPDLHLWLIGDGPLRAELEQQAAALGLAGQVRFLGVRSDVGDYMQAAALLLLTSDSEGIPRVILEAGLMGLPVVSSRVGGIAEFVVSGQTGLLAPPEAEDELAQAVVQLLDAPDARREMGQQAQALIEANYTTAHIARQYLAFYRQVQGR